MQSKSVTIIIPTFNEEKNILACINSLLAQHGPKNEIIIVDDGSTDGTLLLIDEAKKMHPELVCLTQKHQGPAKARNLAAHQAKGQILVFMDADMTFDRDFIKDLIRPIVKGQYQGTFSKEEYISNWSNVWSRCWNYNQDLPPKRMIPKNYPNQGQDFRAILKKDFLRVGGFDDSGYTDTWSLVKKLGYRPQAVKGARYYHANPDNLAEVFTQAKWVAKRAYKFGILGKVVALIRTSFLISFFVAIIKAIKYRELRFLIFKIVYDLASFIGIWEMILRGKLAK